MRTSPSPSGSNSIQNAALALGAMVVFVMILALLAQYGQVASAQKKAELAKPFCEQQIAAGSKKYWRIPDYPKSLYLQLSAKQCKRFWEVEPSGREIDWAAPYESRVLWYEVRARNTKTGVTRILWPGKEFRSGDRMPDFDLFREELSIRVSRVSGLPTYLKLDMLFIPDSFGIPGGPFGKETVE